MATYREVTLSGKARTIVIVVVALAIAIASPFLFKTGDPHVSVKAETLFFIGGNQSLPFSNALPIMLLTDLVLIVLAFMATSSMSLIPRGVQNVMEIIIESLHTIFGGVNREWIDRGPTFPLVATIFLFVMVANWLGLVPGVGPIGLCQGHAEETHEVQAEPHAIGARMRLAFAGSADSGMGGALLAEETETPTESAGPQVCPPGTHLVPMFRTPSADLNFTFGLALLAFIYVEIVGFQALGIGYLGKFFNFHDFSKGFLMGIIGVLVGLLELISEFARILAFAFRLFGNIFAGEVLLLVLASLVPLVLTLPFFMFEVFVGFIQAFVFSILTMAFIAIAVTPHGGDNHAEAHH